ncbi:unnamed protein product [Choristocarpus tenellus]
MHPESLPSPELGSRGLFQSQSLGLPQRCEMERADEPITRDWFDALPTTSTVGNSRDPMSSHPSDGTRGGVSDLSDSGADEDNEMEDEDDEDDREYTGCFEGPEKTLEVCFKPGIGHLLGCRGLTRQSLDRICRRAKCTILHKISNNHLDAYVLSESSLFVYAHKVVIKTCGTTTLLRCITTLLHEAGKEMGLVLEWVGYSRKNFTFPGDQLFPHSSFHQELQYLKAHSHLSQQLNGAGYVLGPVTGDHWFVYVADKCDRPDYTSTDRTVNMMMFDMHPDVAKLFYKEVCPTGRVMTQRSGISELVPGALMDDIAFDPCGYSMNAIQYESYYTIHVTPEEKCSYASFETNNPFRSYRSIINNVLHVFRPKRWVLTMVADKAGLNTLTENPFDMEHVELRKRQFVRTSVCSTVVEGDCVCVMGAWDLREKATDVNNSPMHRLRCGSIV